ncbi:hypothetical protein K469DRAFT_42178 [Zopfia rhizophila CBS 207.26]|uniref:Uncharacterized protein n=1 Tax=Zopfia rhizophila CBS 207.26 TaxID=1314779 RepID=A0A6A6EE57_9PEZI|nr:hypothetical protein K469DRAFT_42178 [Zopfia rhizophila CBS 207.26]
MARPRTRNATDLSRHQLARTPTRSGHQHDQDIATSLNAGVQGTGGSGTQGREKEHRGRSRWGRKSVNDDEMGDNDGEDELADGGIGNDNPSLRQVLIALTGAERYKERPRRGKKGETRRKEGKTGREAGTRKEDPGTGREGKS